MQQGTQIHTHFLVLSEHVKFEKVFTVHIYCQNPHVSSIHISSSGSQARFEPAASELWGSVLNSCPRPLIIRHPIYHFIAHLTGSIHLNENELAIQMNDRTATGGRGVSRGIFQWSWPRWRHPPAAAQSHGSPSTRQLWRGDGLCWPPEGFRCQMLMMMMLTSCRWQPLETGWWTRWMECLLVFFSLFHSLVNTLWNSKYCC